MNGQVEFEDGMYSYVVEYYASVEYDEGTYDTPPYLEWDVMEDDIVITRTDEEGNEVYIDANVLDEELLKTIWMHIDNDIVSIF